MVFSYWSRNSMKKQSLVINIHCMPLIPLYQYIQIGFPFSADQVRSKIRNRYYKNIIIRWRRRRSNRWRRVNDGIDGKQAFISILPTAQMCDVCFQFTIYYIFAIEMNSQFIVMPSFLVSIRYRISGSMFALFIHFRHFLDKIE